VHDGRNGLIVPGARTAFDVAALERLQTGAAAIAATNRDWVAAHALFAPSIDAFVARLEQSTFARKNAGPPTP